MIESAVVLTPLHYAYLIGVIVILAVMVLKKDTPAVCIAFLFILGLIGLKSVTGGIITVFSAVLYAGREFMEVLATIALVTSLSKCLKDLGSDYLMMVPMAGIMKTPSPDLVDPGAYHVPVFPVPVAQSLGCTGGSHHAALCCKGRPESLSRSHGHEPVRTRLCAELRCGDSGRSRYLSRRSRP